MAEVVIALGSNRQNPHQQLKQAKSFLEHLSEDEIKQAPLYESEPVGPAEGDFLNSVVVIHTSLKPAPLFEKLKGQERKQGRPSRYPKWTDRTLDLDIIGYDDLVIETDSLIIPHQEYTRRLFVLLPLRDIFPLWRDPVTAQDISDMIQKAPSINITRTNLSW